MSWQKVCRCGSPSYDHSTALHGPRPDQLDVQVSVARNFIRRDANDARHRLGLEPRNYDHAEPGDSEL